jgi:hypothetical protein
MCDPSATETFYLYHSTWVRAHIVSLFKDKIEQGWVNSCAVIKGRRFCCTRGTHRVTVQNSDTLGAPNAAETSYLYHSTWVHSAFLILSLNSDTMCAPSAAEASYLYHSTWVHSALLFKDKIEQGWVNSCALIKVRSFCCTRGTHRVTVQRQDWTRLSELMCCDKGKTFLETSYLYHSTWVHSVLFNLVFEQWHDGCP